VGDLSKHFSRTEFACTCMEPCGCDTVDSELIKVLEEVREKFGKSITITSGHRCPAHNKRVGGAKTSQHLTGRAADIKVEDTDSRKVYEYLDKRYPQRLGLGNYLTFTHVDTRGGPARW
jgi:uncharacterized protein YcbK (DUF882 family)